MNAILFFLGPQEIVLIFVLLPGILILFLIIWAIKYLRGKSRPQKVAGQFEKNLIKNKK